MLKDLRPAPGPLRLQGASFTSARDPLLRLWLPMMLPVLLTAVLWTLVPALMHTAPPLDVVESAMWGREWVIGTYKHPGMPGWFIEAGRWLDGGRIGWPVYATGQMFNLATLGLTFALARDLAGQRVATAAVLALLGVENFSWRTPEFNHTQAQMPFWVGSVWCLARALPPPTSSLGHEPDQRRDPMARRRMVWWVLLGAVAAAGLYAKLSNAVLLLVIAGWMLASRRGRRAIGGPGPWAAALVFAIVSVPLIRWLLQSHFAAFVYAGERGQDQAVSATLLFPINAALQAAPLVLALAVAGVFARPVAEPTMRDVLTSADDDRVRQENRRFLWVMALAPPLLAVASALLSRSGIRTAWMAPALPLVAVLLLDHWADGLTDRVLARLSRLMLAVAVTVPLIYGFMLPHLGRLSGKPLLRVNWPQEKITQALAAAWSTATGRPLRIVAGGAWLAGLVGLDHPDHPSILTEGRFDYAPWITPERLRREGALAIWSEGRGNMPMPELQRLIVGRPVHDLQIPAPRGQKGEVISIKYAILPPG